MVNENKEMSEDNNPLHYKLNEQERINKFLRGEVDELRREIERLNASKIFKLVHRVKQSFPIRIYRKLFRTAKKIFYNFRYKQKVKFQLPNSSIDIIIPVFKKYDLLRNLLVSLNLDLYKNIGKVIIVEDSGKPGNSGQIEQIIYTLKLQRELFLIVVNDENLGYGSSVNKAWQFVESDFAVLINTDIELPKYWMERLLLPFQDERVALVTPLATNSGANLTINLENKQNWRNFDAELRHFKANYPQACTAIGYCLGVRKKAIKSTKLFNEDFIHGYGEDSDLHFEVLSEGYKSVVVDNLVVWHFSSASYSTLIDISSFRDSNVKKFHDKWGEKYQRDLAVWNKSAPLQKINNLTKNIVKQKKVDLLFFQLSNNFEIGGIAQLQSIYRELILRESNVGIVYLNHDPSIKNDGSDLIFLVSELKQLEANKIVFSGLESFLEINKYPNLQSAKKINFLQGPDYLFPGNESKITDFQDSITLSNRIITQSHYLEKLANFFGNDHIVTITLGPKRSIFYDSGVRKEKVLVIPTRKDSDKGLRFLLPILTKLIESGWRTIGIGDLPNPTIAGLFTKHLGRVSNEIVSEQLQSAAALIDLSSYEGLGLSALEAGLCGTQPIVSRKGGINSLLGFSDELIIINDPLDINEIFTKITNLDLSQIENNRNHLSNEASRYSWESSIDLIIKEILRD